LQYESALTVELKKPRQPGVENSGDARGVE
jgi:hypothetical protein